MPVGAKRYEVRARVKSKGKIWLTALAVLEPSANLVNPG